MLTFTTSETHPLEIQVKLRRPALYLDSCVISDLAGTQKGERLRKLICGTGTLHIVGAPGGGVRDWAGSYLRADYSAMSAHLLATRIQLELLRETVRTHETFNESDALDFSHAVIGIAYCDYAVLDKKWARRCRKVDLPRAAATVYDGTEIDRLLAACENWKA